MWAAVLLGAPVSPWTVVSILCVFICALRFPKASASENDTQSVYKCPYPEAPNPDQHNKFLDGLNGTRIVFIGDSITRFQYITLASFLAKGFCASKDNRQRMEEYANLYHPGTEWDDFFRHSSRSLNTPLAVETCFCEWERTFPETRSFTYKDEQVPESFTLEPLQRVPLAQAPDRQRLQGRRIQVDFMFYENEMSRPLSSYIQKAVRPRLHHRNIGNRFKLKQLCDHMPTYVSLVCTFGPPMFQYLFSGMLAMSIIVCTVFWSLWHLHLRNTCAYKPMYTQTVKLLLLSIFSLTNTFTLQTNLRPNVIVLNFGLWMEQTNRDCGRAGGDGHCPQLSEICEFLKGEHAFSVIWQTTTPKWSVGNTLTDHHLHIPHACTLDPTMVLHRGIIFKALSTEMDDWTGLYHDDLHFAPPAYHAFNGVLLDMITSGDIGHGQQAVANQS